jgi:hypothetical protein
VVEVLLVVGRRVGRSRRVVGRAVVLVVDRADRADRAVDLVDQAEVLVDQVAVLAA